MPLCVRNLCCCFMLFCTINILIVLKAHEESRFWIWLENFKTVAASSTTRQNLLSFGPYLPCRNGMRCTNVTENIVEVIHTETSTKLVYNETSDAMRVTHEMSTLSAPKVKAHYLPQFPDKATFMTLPEHHPNTNEGVKWFTTDKLLKWM